MLKTLLIVIFCLPQKLLANEDSWSARESFVVRELSEAFDKFKLRAEKEKFARNQKAWTDFSKKNCGELYEGFKEGTEYNSMLQDCMDRSVKFRLKELRAVYFQTWPKSLNHKIDHWLK